MPGITELYVSAATAHIAHHVQRGRVKKIRRRHVDFLVLEALDRDRTLPLEHKFAFYNAILLHPARFDSFWLGQQLAYDLTDSALRAYTPDSSLEQWDAPSTLPTFSTHSSSNPHHETGTRSPSPSAALSPLPPSRKRKSHAPAARTTFASPIIISSPSASPPPSKIVKLPLPHTHPPAPAKTPNPTRRRTATATATATKRSAIRQPAPLPCAAAAGALVAAAGAAADAKAREYQAAADPRRARPLGFAAWGALKSAEGACGEEEEEEEGEGVGGPAVGDVAASAAAYQGFSGGAFAR
ncbi:hypothetical protein MMC13_005777 [Lambiella insularis]|nr:hypothetical protein [Lambiella insularis]